MQADMQIRFLCLNLWHSKFLNEIIAFIKKEHPDILALQEVFDGTDASWEAKYRTRDILRQELGYPYEYFSASFLECLPFGKVPEGNLILSKFPIQTEKTMFFDIPFGERLEDTLENAPFTPRSFQHVSLLAEGKTLNIFNTQGVWGLDGGDNERRIAMGKTIADNVKDQPNTILAGDFNVNPNTRTINQIEEHLTNVFKGELISTFNMKHKSHPGFATAVVDMIFISPNIQVKEHICHTDDVSDHLGLSAILEI